MNPTKYIYLKITYFILCLWVFPTIVCSQNMVKHISNVNGLSNNSVNCFFEDSQHTLWIGTWDGLNAFNGRDFKTYRYSRTNKSSISNNVIRQVIEQDSSYIWVATDYGINRWNRKTQEFDTYFLGTEHNKPKQEKSYLLGLSSHQIIICYVKEQGLFYFDNTKREFISIENKLNVEIKDFVIDSDDNIFFLTEKGALYKYQLEYNTGKLSLDKETFVEVAKPVSSIFLTNNLLVVNYGNYFKIIDDKNSYPSTIDIAENKTISQVIYNEGSLFISFVEGGCIQYNIKSKSFIPLDGISDKLPVFTIYAGSQNILWVGTDGQGIMQVYDYTSPFRTVKTNYPVRSFCENEDGTILIGTKGEGIKLLDKITGVASDFVSLNNGLISNSVYTMSRNRNGDIFVGTEGAGVNIITKNTNRVERLSIPNKYPFFRAVYSILFTHNDTYLWLGTSGYGLIRIQIRKDADTYIVEGVRQYLSSDNDVSLNNNVIYSIVKGENDNELWLGTRGGGVNRFNVQTELFSDLENIDSNLILTNNDVLALMKGAGNSLWVGTSYGLNQLFLKQNPPAIEEYVDDNGLANNTIHGILEDKNKNIWISTNLGLSFIDLKTKRITNYTSRNGLQNDEFSDGAYFRDQSNNILYFGGVSGFNYFAADEIHLRDYSPTISLSNLRIYNTNQNIYERIVDNTLKLSYDEPYVTFSFIAHDFINNENCEFSYRVLNFSDEWINNGNSPNIAITKLPPGKYKLEVKCTNGDRVWSNNIYTLNLNIAYPWWLSTPAFIAYLLLILLIIYIAQSVIRNRIRLNRQLLLEHIEKQHQQKIHESKLNFFTNVAHEFFTPLTLIYGPAQHLLEKADLDNYSKRYIQIIKNNADRMQKLINELMEFRKAESGHTSLHAENIDIKLLIDYISDNYAEIIEENRIDFKIEDENISTFVTDRNSLEKILFNLISNAFKYTPNGGYIYAYIWQDNDPSGQLHFRIRNSGRGLTDRQMSEIFSRFKIFETSKLQNAHSTGIGLNLTKSLAELLGGTITVDSVLGEYVEFDVVLNPMKLQATEININNDNEIESVLVGNEFVSEKKDISILIVEDEKNIRELLKDILTPYYNIREACNGEEGLAEVEMNMPDIIISDILMPNLDGIGLIDRLKSDDKTAHIPIISISAKNSVEDHINAYKHGADLYITKPFHPRHVLTTVENIINKQLMLKKYFNSSRSAVTVKDGITLHQEDEQLLQEIIHFIENNIDDESLNPNSISEFLGISKATLYRRLKDLTDKTPSEFVRAIRLDYASRLLKTTKLTVAEIMFKSGFSNKSYFYREFAKQFNVSPKEYRSSDI